MYMNIWDKPAPQWTVQDIEAWVGFEEGAYLEFKKATEFLTNGQYVRSKLVEEIVETASAFLNADGGTILLGVQTDLSADDKRVEYLKPTVGWERPETLEERGINQTASQVQEIINSNLSPRPFGIQVNRVEVSVGDMVTGVMVVTIPASQMGAHQSLRTYRYYRRIGDADMPMADYEIRDVNSRRLGPLLSLRMFGLRDFGGIFQYSRDQGVTQVKPSRTRSQAGVYDDFYLLVRVLNSGNGTAHAGRFQVGIPVASDFHTSGPWESGWFANTGLASVLGSNTSVSLSPAEIFSSFPNGQILVGVSEEPFSGGQGVTKVRLRNVTPFGPTSMKDLRLANSL